MGRKMMIQFTESNIAGMILQVASADWFKLVQFMDVPTGIFPIRNNSPAHEK